MNINLEKEMATHLGKFTYAWESQNRGAWWAVVYGVAQSDVTEET